MDKRNDLSLKEDLSLAVINLINIEEHLAFTVMKTGKEEYIDVWNVVRKLRIKLLSELVTNKEGEMWCISKHLLCTTMRLMETSSKYIEHDKKKANDFLKEAFDVYKLFWMLQDEVGNVGRTEKNKKVEK
ncbi:MAG: hypothetical protein HY832_02635 [Candidatus Aenigmarchaeota archaeon]|nr:hypothetical protein [Candidatus Aenigmarchaeota archaeon]